MTPVRVVLVGATGVFGRRLSAMLSGMPDLELVLAARNVGALNRLRAQLEPSRRCAGVSATAFDRDRPEGLAALCPWLTIDAAGPFQGSGYALPLAAVRAGSHYIDLADSRAFVAGFSAAVQVEASAAGVSAITGASSTPALSHAALEHLTAGWRHIDSIVVAIAPGARAPAGLSVVAAILSYAGQPVRVFRDGRWSNVPGWSGTRRLDMPGLGRRWASVCETPDLDLLPRRFAVRRTALFMAGLELAPLHLGLAAMSTLVRWGLLLSLRPFARPLRAVAALFVPFGSDRGGMIADAWGADANGDPIRARWALWAEANAGPNTPAAPAAALVRALLEGRAVPRGAMTSAGLLPLTTIIRELAAFPIRTRVDEGYTTHPALFCRLLGRRFAALPPAVRAVHAGSRPATFNGRAVTRAGRGLVAGVLRAVLGLPTSGHCAVQVSIVPDRGGETWTRTFGESRFASKLLDSRRLGIFQEQFGLLRFEFRVDATDRGVAWDQVGWRFAGVRLPLALAPRLHAAGEESDGRYRFRVVVAHPWTGLLFAYRGTLGIDDRSLPVFTPGTGSDRLDVGPI